MHGARGGAPKGSKNALVTGEYEELDVWHLTDEEKAQYSSLRTDELEVLDEQIRIQTIRAQRMMKRIKDVFDGPELQTTGAFKGEQQQDARLERAQRIEEALTRVTGEIRLLVSEKRKLGAGVGDEEGVLEDLTAAIERSRQQRGAAPDED